MKRAVIIVLALFATVYVCDDASVRFRVPNSLDSVKVQPYYAIRRKDGRIEYDFNVPLETQTCARSLFPHLGYPACWYLRRHNQRKIEI